MCRISLCVRSAIAMAADPELSYREGLRRAAAPIPGLALPPPPALGSVYLAPLEGEGGEDAEQKEEEAVQRAVRDGAPRRLKARLRESP